MVIYVLNLAAKTQTIVTVASFDNYWKKGILVKEKSLTKMIFI